MILWLSSSVFGVFSLDCYLSWFTFINSVVCMYVMYVLTIMCYCYVFMGGLPVLVLCVSCYPITCIYTRPIGILICVDLSKSCMYNYL